MNPLLTMALKDLRVFFADRSNIVGLVALPLAFTLVLGYFGMGNAPRTLSIEQQRVDVVDADQSPASAALLVAFDAALPAAYFLCPAQDSPTTPCGISGEWNAELGKTRVRDGLARALLLIDAGYGEALAAQSPATLTYYSANSALSVDDVVATALTTATGRLNTASIAGQVGVQVADSLSVAGAVVYDDEAGRAAFRAEVEQAASSTLNATALPVRYETVAGGEPVTVGTGFGQSVPGQGSMFVMFTVFSGLYFLIAERRRWTLQRTLTLPVAKWQIVGSKIASLFVLGMIQYAVVFGVGLLVGARFGDDPLALVLVMVSFALCVTALALAISTRVKTDMQANAAQLLLSLTLAPLGGAWWPLSITPPFMQTLGKLSPVAWAMEGFNSLIFYGGSLVDVLLPCAVLLGAAGLFFVLGVRGFQYE